MRTVGTYLDAVHRRVPAMQKVIPRSFRWNLISQPKELTFHQQCQWRPSPAFQAQNQYLFSFFGYGSEDFAGKTIIDLGAGSKLRTSFFESTSIVVIEPLANAFMRTIPWCDLSDARAVFSEPAEKTIRELEQEADLVVSINVLDHCHQPKRVIENCWKYLKPSGELCLSVDLHDRYDPLHPVNLDRDILLQMICDCGFEVKKVIEGLGEIGSSYSTRDLAVTVIARKAR